MFQNSNGGEKSLIQKTAKNRTQIHPEHPSRAPGFSMNQVFVTGSQMAAASRSGGSTWDPWEPSLGVRVDQSWLLSGTTPGGWMHLLFIHIGFI